MWRLYDYSGAKTPYAKLKSDRNCSRSPGSGRKRKTSDRSDCLITKHSKSGTPTKKQLQCICSITGSEWGQSFIQNYTVTPKREGYQVEKKDKKPFVSEIGSNRLARISCACQHNGWSADDWKHVVFVEWCVLKSKERPTK